MSELFVVVVFVFFLALSCSWTCAITATAGDTVSDSLTCAAEAVTVPIRQQRNRIAMIDFFIEFPLKILKLCV